MAADVTLRDYVNTFFYYRKVAIAVFLAIVLAGIVISLVRPMPYRAQATLLVLFAGYYDQSNGSLAGAAALAPAVGQLVSVEAQILSSPELHRDVVVSQLGPHASSRDIDNALQAFENRFHIEQNDLANTINVSYLDADPKKAAEALGRLLDVYFRQRATIFTSGRESFLSARRDDVKVLLDKADAALVAFQQANGVVNINDQISRAVALESMLVQRKLENDAALAQDRSALQSLLSSAKNVQPNISLFTDNSEVARALANMQQSLVQLEARRADFSSRYLPSSPFVQQLDQQIADMRASIVKQKQQLVNTTRYGHNTYYDTVQDRLSSLTSNIAGEQARQKELQGQVDAARANQQKLIGVSNQLRQLVAERDILADSYRDQARQVELASIQQGQASKVNSTNVRIIQAPIPPSRRSISSGMVVAASFVAGILIAAMVVLVLSTLRETFLSPEQVERSLLLPVLSAPFLWQAAKRRRRAKAGPQSAAGEASRPAAEEASQPRSAVNAHTLHMAYGRLVSAIHDSSDATSKIVMTIASGTDDGLSRVVQGVAVELEHRLSGSILIFDMESAPDASPYGRPDAQGVITWSDVAPSGGPPVAFPDNDDTALLPLAFHRVDHHSITVAWFKNGTTPPSRHHVANVLATLRTRYDYVLIHAPAASQSFVGVESAGLVDATVLVIRAESTRKPVAQGLKEQILNAGGLLIGAAMTYRRAYIPRIIYRAFS